MGIRIVDPVRSSYEYFRTESGNNPFDGIDYDPTRLIEAADIVENNIRTGVIGS